MADTTTEKANSTAQNLAEFEQSLKKIESSRKKINLNRDDDLKQMCELLELAGDSRINYDRIMSVLAGKGITSSSFVTAINRYNGYFSVAKKEIVMDLLRSSDEFIRRLDMISGHSLDHGLKNTNDIKYIYEILILAGNNRDNYDAVLFALANKGIAMDDVSRAIVGYEDSLTSDENAHIAETVVASSRFVAGLLDIRLSTTGLAMDKPEDVGLVVDTLRYAGSIYGRNRVLIALKDKKINSIDAFNAIKYFRGSLSALEKLDMLERFMESYEFLNSGKSGNKKDMLLSIRKIRLMEDIIANAGDIPYVIDRITPNKHKRLRGFDEALDLTPLFFEFVQYAESRGMDAKMVTALWTFEEAYRQLNPDKIKNIAQIHAEIERVERVFGEPVTSVSITEISREMEVVGVDASESYDPSTEIPVTGKTITIEMSELLDIVEANADDGLKLAKILKHIKDKELHGKVIKLTPLFSELKTHLEAKNDDYTGIYVTLIAFRDAYRANGGRRSNLETMEEILQSINELETLADIGTIERPSSDGAMTVVKNPFIASFMGITLDKILARDSKALQDPRIRKILMGILLNRISNDSEFNAEEFLKVLKDRGVDSTGFILTDFRDFLSRQSVASGIDYDGVFQTVIQAYGEMNPDSKKDNKQKLDEALAVNTLVSRLTRFESDFNAAEFAKTIDELRRLNDEVLDIFNDQVFLNNIAKVIVANMKNRDSIRGILATLKPYQIPWNKTLATVDSMISTDNVSEAVTTIATIDSSAALVDEYVDLKISDRKFIESFSLNMDRKRLNVFFAQYPDARLILENTKTAVQDKYDLIIKYYGDSNAMVAIVQSLKDSGIKLMDFYRDMAEYIKIHTELSIVEAKLILGSFIESYKHINRLEDRSVKQENLDRMQDIMVSFRRPELGDGSLWAYVEELPGSNKVKYNRLIKHLDDSDSIYLEEHMNEIFDIMIRFPKRTLYMEILRTLKKEGIKIPIFGDKGFQSTELFLRFTSHMVDRGIHPNVIKLGLTLFTDAYAEVNDEKMSAVSDKPLDELVDIGSGLADGISGIISSALEGEIGGVLGSLASIATFAQAKIIALKKNDNMNLMYKIIYVLDIINRGNIPTDPLTLDAVNTVLEHSRVPDALKYDVLLRTGNDYRISKRKFIETRENLDDFLNHLTDHFLARNQGALQDYRGRLAEMLSSLENDYINPGEIQGLDSKKNAIRREISTLDRYIDISEGRGYSLPVEDVISFMNRLVETKGYSVLLRVAMNNGNVFNRFMAENQTLSEEVLSSLMVTISSEGQRDFVIQHSGQILNLLLSLADGPAKNQIIDKLLATVGENRIAIDSRELIIEALAYMRANIESPLQMERLNIRAVRDLSGLNFAGLSIRNTDFSENNLSISSFRNARIENCRFTWSNLARADFTNTRVKGSDFSASNMMGSNFYRSKIIESEFNSNDISYAKLNQSLALRYYRQYIVDIKNGDPALAKERKLSLMANCPEYALLFLAEDKKNGIAKTASIRELEKHLTANPSVYGNSFVLKAYLDAANGLNRETNQSAGIFRKFRRFMNRKSIESSIAKYEKQEQAAVEKMASSISVSGDAFMGMENALLASLESGNLGKEEVVLATKIMSDTTNGASDRFIDLLSKSYQLPLLLSQVRGPAFDDLRKSPNFRRLMAVTEDRGALSIVHESLVDEIDRGIRQNKTKDLIYLLDFDAEIIAKKPIMNSNSFEVLINTRKNINRALGIDVSSGFSELFDGYLSNEDSVISDNLSAELFRVYPYEDVMNKLGKNRFSYNVFEAALKVEPNLLETEQFLMYINSINNPVVLSSIITDLSKKRGFLGLKASPIASLKLDSRRKLFNSAIKNPYFTADVFVTILKNSGDMTLTEMIIRNVKPANPTKFFSDVATYGLFSSKEELELLVNTMTGLNVATADIRHFLNINMSKNSKAKKVSGEILEKVGTINREISGMVDYEYVSPEMSSPLSTDITREAEQIPDDISVMDRYLIGLRSGTNIDMKEFIATLENTEDESTRIIYLKNIIQNPNLSSVSIGELEGFVAHTGDRELMDDYRAKISQPKVESTHFRDMVSSRTRTKLTISQEA